MNETVDLKDRQLIAGVCSVLREGSPSCSAMNLSHERRILC